MLDTNDADENKTEQAEEAVVDEDIDFSLARKKKKKPRGEAVSIIYLTIFTIKWIVYDTMSLFLLLNNAVKYSLIFGPV